MPEEKYIAAKSDGSCDVDQGNTNKQKTKFKALFQ